MHPGAVRDSKMDRKLVFYTSDPGSIPGNFSTARNEPWVQRHEWALWPKIKN